MVKSEESKVYAKREPLWRILRYEQSEFGEGETNVSAKWARLCRVSWEKGARQIRTQ